VNNLLRGASARWRRGRMLLVSFLKPLRCMWHIPRLRGMLVESVSFYPTTSAAKSTRLVSVVRPYIAAHDAQKQCKKALIFLKIVLYTEGSPFAHQAAAKRLDGRYKRVFNRSVCGIMSLVSNSIMAQQPPCFLRCGLIHC
jgi:hypothetical protein